MTRVTTATYIVISHAGPPRGFWRTEGRPMDDWDEAQELYKQTILTNPAAGGVRLLKDGIPIRYAGAMGKPGGEE